MLNSRFLLLPQKRPQNLASRLLAMSLTHLPDDWYEHYSKRPLLAETFVDPEGFKGTCYRASGWIKAGITAGYSRVLTRDFYQDNEHPKDLWLKPLSKNALEALSNPSQLLQGEDPKARAPGAMPISSKQAESLSKAFREVEDPRSVAATPTRFITRTIVY